MRILIDKEIARDTTINDSERAIHVILSLHYLRVSSSASIDNILSIFTRMHDKVN